MDIITFYESEDDYTHYNKVAESSMVQYYYSRLHREITYKRNAGGSLISVKDYRRAEMIHSEYGFTHIVVILGGKYEEA
jgi:hypothetical protein